MLKTVLAFVLTRRTIILMSPARFYRRRACFAYSKLNIEAYPNPAPVILEITAQAAGPVRRGDGALLHDPDGGRACRHTRSR